MSITVLTSITGAKDKLTEGQMKGDSKFVAYVDEKQWSESWDIKKAYDRFKDNRRNSRVPKILAHQYADTDYSIWIDGNMQLLRPPQEIVDKFLLNHDLAVFMHPHRDCIYDECIKCAKAGLDEPEVIIEQAKTYEDMGYAKHKGLCECGFIVRRHTDKVEQFNNAWWSEYCRHSCRDQISFMYAVDKVGIRVNFIDWKWSLCPNGIDAMKGDFLKITPHIIPNPKVE